MRILLSNDDGIHSPCLRALHDALCEAGHELDVVAPLTEQSGVAVPSPCTTPCACTRCKSPASAARRSRERPWTA